MVELRKEKLFGRLVRGRLTQPIEEEEEVGATHLIEEKKKGENKTIEALTSDSGEILTSEGQKANFVFDYFTRLYRLELNNFDDHRATTRKLPAQWIASPADNKWTNDSNPGQDGFLSCITNKLSVEHCLNSSTCRPSADCGGPCR